MSREQFLQMVRTYIEADPEAALHVAGYVQAGLNAALSQAYERAADMECALAALLFGTELARASNGRFQPEPWLEDENAVPQVYGTSHHMGTTRMSADPQQGVVDRECRVHGVENLYVAGSSVFPTSGANFPTISIAAMTIRLADHLHRVIGQTA